MRRGVLLLLAVAAVSVAFGLSEPSAQKLTAAPHPAPTRAGVPVSGDPGIGPGWGGVGSLRNTPPIRFLGITTQKFPVGVGALAASRACNADHPNSRLCEWSDIFREIPPVVLESEVLVAPNYETNPVPACLNPAGGLRCGPSPLMRPAACCGISTPPPSPSPASIALTPSGPQTVTACSDSFEFTATALDGNGAPMEGMPLVFEFPPVVGGTLNLIGVFNPSSGLSDANGEVQTTLSLFESACEFNCAGPGHDCSAVIQAHDLGRLVVSNPVNLIDQIP